MRATPRTARTPSSPSADASPATSEATGRARPPVLAVATAALVAAAALATLAGLLAAEWPGGGAAHASEEASTAWRPQNDEVNSAVGIDAGGGIAFADHRRGLAVGDAGMLQATIDGGDTWIPQPLPPFDGEKDPSFRDVVFAPTGHAVAVGSGVWTSPDGGRNWTQRYLCESSNPCRKDSEDRVIPTPRLLPTVTMVEAPSCPDQQPRCHGWAAAGRMGVFHTTDGGKNWTRQEFPSQGGGVANTINNDYTVRDVSFIDHTTGWAVLPNGAVFHTDDGGDTWSQTTGDQVLTSHRSEMWAVHFVDNTTGWIVGGSTPPSVPPGIGVIWRTDDGGDTWAQQSHPAPDERQRYRFNDVAFTDTERGYVVGGLGDAGALVYATADGGETWSQQEIGRSIELTALDLAAGPDCGEQQPRCHAWAVGSSGHGNGIIHTDGDEWLSQLPTLSAFHALSAVDQRHVRLLGAIDIAGDPDDVLLATEDAGRSWTDRGPDIDADELTLEDISCTTRTHCHVVGESGGGALAVTTENGGESWERQDLGGDQDPLRAVACTDPDHCHVAGDNGLIFTTDDGGQSWQRQHACENSTGSQCDADSDGRLSNRLQSVFFRDGHNEGVIVGNRAAILTTDDGGKTWTSRVTPDGVQDPLRDVACDGDGSCLAVGGKFTTNTPKKSEGDCGVVLASGDGGASWTVVERNGSCDGNDNGEVFTAVACDAGTCRVSGTGGILLSTSDAGGSLDPEDVPSSRMFSALGTAGGRAWVGSDLGQVYSTYHPPGAVDNLEVDALDGSTAEVRWQAPSRDGRGIPAPPATDYEVRVASSPLTVDTFGEATPCGDCGEFSPEKVSDQVIAVVEGLEPGTQRFVAVRAIDEAGDAGPVRSASVELPDEVAPGTVDDLAATAVSATSVELSWSAPASNGESGPPVRRFHIGQARQPITADSFGDAGHTTMLCPEAGCELPAPEAVGDELTLTVEDLAPDSEYHYALRPVDAAGNTGALSDSVSVATLADASTPARVGDLTATGVSPTRIRLTWSAPDGGRGAPAGRFVVKQRQGGGFAGEGDFADALALCGGECVFDPDEVGDRLELTVTDLTPDTAYAYALKPVDEAGNTGPRSNTAQATTPAGAESDPVAGDGGDQAPAGDTPAGVETAAEGVVRVSGADRIATAVAASREAFAAEQAQAAVVARADDFADGLAGVPLAAAENGPLLLTHSGRLDERVAGELDRVLADGAPVFVLGGPAALAESVEAGIADLGFEPVRLAGASRFETAAVIAEDGLGAPDEVLVATGGDFADAVTAGAAAARRGAAVLLSAGDRLPPATAGYRDRHPATAEYAVGGPAARAVPQATALVGATRFETAAVVADELFTDPATVGVATGLAFADPLSGGAHIAAYGGPMLLSGPDRLHPAAGDYLTAQAVTIESAVVYGGPAALADAVADQTSVAITGQS